MCVYIYLRVNIYLERANVCDRKRTNNLQRVRSSRQSRQRENHTAKESMRENANENEAKRHIREKSH